MANMSAAPFCVALLVVFSVISCFLILPYAAFPIGSWITSRLLVQTEKLHSLYDTLVPRLQPLVSISFDNSFPGLQLFGVANGRLSYQRIEWKRGSFAVNGITLSYYKTVNMENYHRRAGPRSQSQPKLVFLHGLVGSASSLIPYLRDMADEYQIFMPDARGHGDTQPIPQHSFLMENLVADAEAAIRHFSPEGPVYLVGHSMGASTAARVAHFYPNLVRAVVLEDPPWLRVHGAVVVPVKHYWTPFEFARSLKNMSEVEFEQMNRRAVGSANLLPPATSGLEAWRRFDADDIEPTFIEADDAINEAVEGIHVPIMVQTGGNESVCVQEVLKATMATWTQGRERNFHGAPHSIHLEPYKQEWVQSIRDFLREHSEVSSQQERFGEGSQILQHAAVLHVFPTEAKKGWRVPCDHKAAGWRRVHMYRL